MSKTHVIDGVTYVEVDRNAKVGEFVAWDGIIRKVTKVDYEEDCVEFDEYKDEAKLSICGWCNGYYKVLEPLKPTLSELLTKCTPENRHEEIGLESPQAILLTADDIKGTPDKVIDVIANLARRVNSLEKQLAATQRNVETFAEQTEENSEDIRELDARTQIIDAINKYYAEGSR